MLKSPENNDSLRELPKPEFIKFYVGAICELINQIAESPEDIRLTNRLRTFLTCMTIPIECAMQIKDTSTSKEADEVYLRYFKEIGQEEIANEFLDPERQQFRKIMSLIMFFTRCNPLIEWHDFVDPLMREKLLNNSSKVDSDSESMISIFNKSFYIRWVFPSPDTFWLCTDNMKLIYCALVMLEELLHLVQEDINILRLGTLGVKMDINDDDQKSVLRILITRMCETDVTNTLTRLVPRMIKENWQWYEDRVTKDTTEDHYPLPQQYFWLMGRVLAEQTGQRPQFLLETMTALPDSIDGDLTKLSNYFSNGFIIPDFNIYLKLLFYTHPEFDDEQNKAREEFRKIELEKVSAFDLFVEYCLYLRQNYGLNWKENLLQSYPEEKKDDVISIAKENLEIITDFFKQKPVFLYNFIKKYGPTKRDKILPKRIKDFDDFLDYVSKYIKVPQAEA